MLRASFDAFSGHVVALSAIGALTIFASGAATAGIQAAAGPAGTGLVILVFVILGNSASGGPFARPLLPGPVEDDRRRAAAGRKRRPGAVGAVLRRRADRGPDPRDGGLGGPGYVARARAGRPHRGPASRPRQRPPQAQRCELWGNPRSIPMPSTPSRQGVGKTRRPAMTASSPALQVGSSSLSSMLRP